MQHKMVENQCNKHLRNREFVLSEYATNERFMGEGRAWVAINETNNEVCDIVYFDARNGPHIGEVSVPSWVLAVKACCAVTNDNRIVYWTIDQLDNVAAAMKNCPDVPTRKQGYRVTELITKASRKWQAAERRRFMMFRERATARLSRKGTVVAGMIARCKFYSH